MQQLTGAQQRFFFSEGSLILLNMSRSDFFGARQQVLQGLQQVGAGAQQLGAAAGAQQLGAAAGAQATGAAQVGAQAGAHAAGAAQVGAQAAGAAHVGAGAQQLAAGAQQLFLLPNRPASALFRPAKHTRAAVIQANFISTLHPDGVGNVRPAPASTPDTLSSGPGLRDQPEAEPSLL